MWKARLFLLAACLLAASLSVPTAAAVGVDEDSPGDDLGIALLDMFARAAECIAAHQDATANEAYLGSRAAESRISQALRHLPDVTVRRGSRVSSCSLFED